MQRFTLLDQNQTPDHSSCLCEQHFTDAGKATAVAHAKQWWKDAKGEEPRVHPKNEVVDFTNWQPLDKRYPYMECVICGLNGYGVKRPADTDYNPYDDGDDRPWWEVSDTRYGKAHNPNTKGTTDGTE